MQREWLTTECPVGIVGRPDTPLVQRDAAVVAMAEVFGHVDAAWSAPLWRRRLIYFARGPRSLVKIGSSRKPLERMTRLDCASSTAKRPAQVGPGRHQLLLLINSGDLNRERALHRALVSECVVGEWFCGATTERFIAELLLRAVPLAESEPQGEANDAA